MRRLFTIVVLMLSAVPAADVLATTVRHPDLLYPAPALEAGIEGWVQVAFWVDAGCNLVLDVHASDPEDVFDEAAVSGLRRSMIAETALVDWSQVPVEQPDEGDILTEVEYRAIREAVAESGPWPTVRTIAFHDNSNTEIACRFDVDGQLLSAEFRRSGELLRGLTGVQLSREQYLLPPDSVRSRRFEFQTDKDAAN